MLIKHSRGQYEVTLVDTDLALSNLPPNSYVVTDEVVHRLYGDRIAANTPVMAVPEGEQSKCLAVAERIFEWLAESKADRSATVVAFGGGVVGDLAGFVAATYMRGVRLIQIPTTLLAQVDSSIGGKVGVDLKAGKNLVGAFWPASEVRVPVGALKTLDSRQFLNGLAEVWKYGYIMDATFVDSLRRNPLVPESANLAEVVAHCIGLKAKVVVEDEFETTGLRAILNFGHTIGHAIEHATGYGPVLHGEAIAYGMIAEAGLGEILGITPKGTADAIRRDLAALNVPSPECWNRDGRQLVQAMRRDKKAERGALAFSLLTEIGACKLIKEVPESDVLKALEAV